MLDLLGLPPDYLAGSTVPLLVLSLSAFIYLCPREGNKLVRLLWLLILIAVPILSPLVAFLYYGLLKPQIRKRKAQAG